MTVPKGKIEFCFPKTPKECWIKEKQNSLFPVGTVILKVVLLHVYLLTQKYFLLDALAHKFASVSRCPTSSHVSQKFKLLFPLSC